MRLPTLAAALVALLSLLASACGSADSAESPGAEPVAAPSSVQAAEPTLVPPTPAPATEAPETASSKDWWKPRLEGIDCPSDVSGIECYRLEVAADRADPADGTVTLPVYVARATGPNPQPDAVVVPEGGPGFDASEWIAYFLDDPPPFLVDRDVVLYDQRGTGLATPSLNCPERESVFLGSLSAVDDHDVELERMLEATDACLSRLTAKSIDLGDYNSEASAADLNDLREALGYSQWNIMGISYGGRLALTTMRSFPDGIRSVIIDSPAALSYGGTAAVRDAADRALGALIEDCEAVADCAAPGELRPTIERIRNRYNAEPIAVTVPNGDEDVELLITGEDIMGGLFNALYITEFIPVIPTIIRQLDDGNTAIVPQLAAAAIPRGLAPADGMTVAVNCADNAGLAASEADRAAAAAPGYWGTVLAVETPCPDAAWAPTSPGFNQPVTSELPALVVAGRYDPITPPEPTEAVADSLSNATYVFAPFGGHGVALADECMTSLTMAFLDDPVEELDLTCVADMPASAFS